MTENPLVHVRWSGDKSIEVARNLILEHHSTELDLPPNLHHALFAHLFPNAQPGRPENVDIEDSTELLTKIAEMRGFESIERLVAAANQSKAKVRVQSPSPKIIFSFD